MAIFCEKYNLLFIMSPRTGCSAIAKVLISELGGKYMPREDILDDDGNIKMQRKHNNIRQLLEHGFLREAELNNIFVFTTVRNHYDSLYSLYIKQRIKYKPLLEDRDSWVHKIPGYVESMRYSQTHSFDEWIIRHYYVHWYRRIKGEGRISLYSEFTERANFVMKYESLQEDFDSVLTKIGYSKKLIIPKYNVTNDKLHDSYREAFTKKSKKHIDHVFKEELIKYGYKY